MIRRGAGDETAAPAKMAPRSPCPEVVEARDLLKVGAFDAACANVNVARNFFKKRVGTFLANDNFVGLFLNLYGRSMVAI